MAERHKGSGGDSTGIPINHNGQPFWLGPSNTEVRRYGAGNEHFDHCVVRLGDGGTGRFFPGQELIDDLEDAGCDVSRRQAPSDETTEFFVVSGCRGLQRHLDNGTAPQ